MSVSKEDVLRVIESVKHPAINLSLVDLGMLRNISINNDSVSVEFVFPFPNIPIKDMLISSVRQPLENMGYSLKVSEAQMTPEEVQRFLELETANWKQ
ncbi:MAG: metal-sulfur cluster biosynthetic enzyme [Spirochaetes bacterium]|nr:MAG: metal-sulfur cluster biosynthetic enzyme [Spirochaetota bacterium]